MENLLKKDKQLTKKELIRRTLQSEKDYKNGNFITQEELKKKSQNW